jgi:hypothetical protein
MKEEFFVHHMSSFVGERQGTKMLSPVFEKDRNLRI